MDSIKNKAVNGIKWSFIDNLANSGITFLVGIILARILTPTEFGILGLITVFIAISNSIVDGGFATALIRKHDATDNDFNTVFYCNLAIAVFLMFVLILFSNTIAVFFKEPLLRKVLPVMSLLLIINAFTIIQRTIFVKKINFKIQAKISLIASVGSGIIGVCLALLKFGVWSLVAQQLSRQVLLLLFFWIYSSWRPRFIFSKDSFNELFGFGSKVLLANLVNTFYQNIFLSIVGKLYSTEQLGKYTRADQFNTIFTNNLTMIVQKVSFPTLSSIQNEKERLTSLFRKTLVYSAIITFAFVFSLAAIARPLILILIGQKWIQSVEYLQIMCLYGVLYPLSILNLNMLNIHGRSDLFLRLEVLKKILFIPVFVVGFYFELKYMLWAAVIYYYIEFICNSYFSEYFFSYGTLKQIKDILPIYLISIIVALCIWCITLFSMPLILTLTIQILLIFILFPIFYEIIGLQEYKELKQIFVKQIKVIFKYEN
jgi:teichuronic acid exporter